MSPFGLRERTNESATNEQKGLQQLRNYRSVLVISRFPVPPIDELRRSKLHCQSAKLKKKMTIERSEDSVFFLF